jgi:hypothetical protein
MRATEAGLVVVAGLTAGLSAALVCGCGGSGDSVGRVFVTASVLRPDNCPTITRATAAPAKASVGLSIAVEVAATDPDLGDRLKFTWSADGAGTFADPGATATAFTCLRAGKATLRIEVADSHVPACVAATELPVECR